MSNHNQDRLVKLVRELIEIPTENPWLEFKENNSNPQEMGKNISALANSAALHDKPYAYLLWGIADDSHAIVGTNFNPTTAKKRNEPIESWLLHLLEPKINFRFHKITMDEKPLILLQINRAAHRPVAFEGKEYIRIGSTTKTLNKLPELERNLWRTFDKTKFEKLPAAEEQDANEVLGKIDYPAYFELSNAPLPKTPDLILDALKSEDIIRPRISGDWDITNLGALLFAKNFKDFPDLKRKEMRVIQYKGKDRTKAIKERERNKGYASGFAELLDYINGILPSNEEIGRALRESVPMFPELAVRELVANALIHQDLHATGNGPMVEIFEDRMEITNPGEPLVATNRFLDAPPKSRNEPLASLMRRLGICEERGSGIDKVIFQIEVYQLPAPLFDAPPSATRIVLFAHKNLRKMDKDDRVRACYLHACLRHVSNQKMTNASLRKRFGIPARNTAEASRLLKEATRAKAIVIEDKTVGTRSRSYLPFWAAPGDTPSKGIV